MKIPAQLDRPGQSLPAGAGGDRDGIHGPPTSDLRSAKGRIRRGEPLTSGFTAPSLRFGSQPPIHDSRFTIHQHIRTGFTLLELLVVTGIIALLLVLVVPAFTSMKSGGDVTNAAYTIKGVLDTARAYAKANNTYVWVGFYEENVSNPSSPNTDTPKIGRVVMSIVASNDGTIIYNSSSPGTIDATRLLQVGKLTKIDNVHLAAFTDGSGGGSTFDTRPPVTFNGTQYRIGDTSPPNSNSTLFQYPVGSSAPAQYAFLKGIQFSPGGMAQIINSTASYSPQPAAEIGVEPTHGNVAPTSIPANVVAVQFSGVGGYVKVYRR